MRRSLFANYAGFAARYLISFVSLPFLSRTLGPTGFGVYVMAISIANIISIVVEFGFGVSALREVSTANDAVARTAILVRISAAKLTLIILTVIMSFAYFLLPFHPSFSGIPSLFIVLLGALQGLNLGWYFQGTGRSGTSALIDGVTQASWVLASMAVVRSGSTVGFVLLAQVVATLSSVIVSHKLAFQTRPALRHALSGIPGELKSGATFFIMRLGTAGFTVLSSLLVGTLTGAEEAGFYNAAERLIGTIIAAFSPAAQVLMPHVVKRFATLGEESMFIASRRIGLTLLALSMICVLGLWLTAPLVIHLLSGRKFDPSIAVLRILSCALPCVAVSQALGVYLAVPLRRDRCFTLSVIAAGATSVLLALLIVPRDGAVGMAVCRVIAEATIGLGLALGLGQTGHLQKLFRPFREVGQ